MNCQIILVVRLFYLIAFYPFKNILGNINFYKKKWNMCFSAYYLYFFLTEISPFPQKNTRTANMLPMVWILIDWSSTWIKSQYEFQLLWFVIYRKVSHSVGELFQWKRPTRTAMTFPLWPLPLTLTLSRCPPPTHATALHGFPAVLSPLCLISYISVLPFKDHLLQEAISSMPRLGQVPFLCCWVIYIVFSLHLA